MTTGEMMDVFDRLKAAGLRRSSDVDEAAMLAEWADQTRHVSVGDMAAAIDRLVQAKPDTWWPSIGAVLELIGQVRRDRPRRGSACALCDGLGWVEDLAPFVANGGVIYAGRVTRCGCRSAPMPTVDRPDHAHRALTAAEARDWWAAQPMRAPAPLTEAEYRARVRAIVARLGMPQEAL